MNKLQSLHMHLLRAVKLNDCNGDAIATDLGANQDLWRSFMMVRTDDEQLTSLSDLEADMWSADTLFILAVVGREDALEKLAQAWGADTVEWIGGHAAEEALGEYAAYIRRNERVILRLWWD
jgi:hypothetical protein